MLLAKNIRIDRGLPPWNAETYPDADRHIELAPQYFLRHWTFTTIGIGGTVEDDPTARAVYSVFLKVALASTLLHEYTHGQQNPAPRNRRDNEKAAYHAQLFFLMVQIKSGGHGPAVTRELRSFYRLMVLSLKSEVNRP